MDEKSLLKKYDLEAYLPYATSEEALAILFVRKYLKKADNTVWVDILTWDAPLYYNPFALEFKQVRCELFPKKTKPKYPPRSNFSGDAEYRLICRAITWEITNRDIKNYRSNGVKGKKYIIDAVRYRLKINSKNYFVDSAPSEIKALAKNLNDRTDPLWEKALKYTRNPYVFKIMSIKRW